MVRRWLAVATLVILTYDLPGRSALADDDRNEYAKSTKLLPKSYPIDFGCVYGRRAATATVGPDSKWMVFEDVRLDDSPRKRSSRTVSYSEQTDKSHFLWRLRFGYLWHPNQFPKHHVNMPDGYRIPLDDLPDFDVTQLEEGRKRLLQKYKDGPRFGFGYGFGIDPVSRAWDTAFDQFPQKAIFAERVLSYDCLPLSENDLLVFLVYRSELTIWHGKRSEDVPFVSFEWKERETLPSGFQENFRVEGDAENYFFVTRSGKVFAALKPAAGRPMRMVALWSDTLRPIRTLIEDANTGRAFAFAPALPPNLDPGTSPDEECVYFELTPNIRTRDYDPPKLPVNKLDGWIKTIVSHVDFLIEKKLITLPAKKP